VNLPAKRGGNKIESSLALVSERGMIVPGPAPRGRERWSIQPITISGNLFGGHIVAERRRRCASAEPSEAPLAERQRIDARWRKQLRTNKNAASPRGSGVLFDHDT
jgi:hypothetical protein